MSIARVVHPCPLLSACPTTNRVREALDVRGEKKKKGTEERAEKRAGKIRRELSLFSSLEETVSRWFKRFRVSPRSPAFLLAVCFSLGRLVDPRRGWGDEEGERERKREKDFWKHARART